MKTLCLKAPAKVNLFLEITGRRPDGYHLLATWMQKLDLQDELEITPREGEGIALSCPESDLPQDRENLAYRAAELFFDSLYRKQGTVNWGAEIILRKNIPVSAGLGGGSSDAAAILRGLNHLFDNPFTLEELCGLGVRLGADVPFFVDPSGSCLATGIGDELVSVPAIEDLLFVLVNPGFSVSTKWAYEKFALTIGQKKSNLARSRIELCKGGVRPWGHDTSQLYDLLYNDLEKVTATEYPQINRIKKELIACGAEAAMMSGSGPTVFAVFIERRKAEECCRILRERYKSTYVASPLG